MKIAVVGTGYVGLVVGACFAENGNDVICVDKDAAKVKALERGRIPIFEPGLEEVVKRNTAERRLTFTTDLPAAVKASDIIFIAVGTPEAEDGSADLKHVLGVARDVGRAMDGYKVIVDKSTVPVGTAEKVRQVVAKETTHPFSVVSNPEFLKQGAAVDDFLKPDRVVIGADDERGARVMTELYAPFTRTGAPIMVMDCASAELCKYAANAMLATRISFMNEVARVCELYGANVDPVLVRRQVGMVFQRPNPFPTMSIKENVLAGVKLNNRRMAKSDADALVEKSRRGANRWNEVTDRLDTPGSGLPGGQQQRLCIARAIAVSPEVILMDEPCSALDPISTYAIEELIGELKNEYTVVIVTHNMQQASRVSDKTAFINIAGTGKPGKLIEYDDTRSIFTTPSVQATEDYVSGRFG